MRLSLLLVASVVAAAGAFAPKHSRVVAPTTTRSTSTVRVLQTSNDKESHKIESPIISSSSTQKFAWTTTMAWLATSVAASAAGPDWGIFEGRTGSLLHPLMMGGLFGLSAYTGFLGLQWRRQRTLGDEISSLKKQMPKFDGSLQQAIEAAADDAALKSKLEAAIPIDKQVQELTQERKDLSSQNLRDRHYTQGAWIALFGTLFAIEGPLNTYARAGKLFPGPHLYAGAGVVALWAAAVACVPYMQKGNDTARSLHIAFNTVAVGLFGWQVVTGIPILLKVIELTKWP